MQIKSLPRKINYFISGFIVLLVGGIVIIFVRHRLNMEMVESPPLPENSEASVTIKNFQHVATENGVQKWTLDAASASLYTDENLVTMNDIAVVFFINDNQKITLTAKNGKLDTRTNNIILTGGIVAVMPPYRLSAENLNYDHQSHIIRTDLPVKVRSRFLSLTADTMDYDIKTTTINCRGNVKGLFHENSN